MELEVLKLDAREKAALVELLESAIRQSTVLYKQHIYLEILDRL